MTGEVFLGGEGVTVLWEHIKRLIGPGGNYMFTVSEDGDLLLHYNGDTAPDFSIGEDGNLYLKLD